MKCKLFVVFFKRKCQCFEFRRDLVVFTGATTDNLPPGVLYRVRATYKYAAEDDDELALEVGDVVQVIEYEDPEEQVIV